MFNSIVRTESTDDAASGFRLAREMAEPTTEKKHAERRSANSARERCDESRRTATHPMLSSSGNFCTNRSDGRTLHEEGAIFFSFSLCGYIFLFLCRLLFPIRFLRRLTLFRSQSQ
jgi:hypothetical protein